MFIGKYNKSVIITYLGVASALIGVYLSLNDKIKFAVICLIITGICDLFDGKFARKCKRTNEEKLFGIEIDSLADMIDFVMLPIILAYSIGLNNWYHLIIYILYTLAAITRLGYFNINAAENNKDNPVKYYSGLPVTYVALILPLVWLLSLVISTDIFQKIYMMTMTMISFLFILNVKIKKPYGIAYLIFGIVAIGVSTIILILG